MKAYILSGKVSIPKSDYMWLTKEELKDLLSSDIYDIKSVCDMLPDN
jgi:hypothetical protein